MLAIQMILSVHAVDATIVPTDPIMKADFLRKAEEGDAVGNGAKPL